VSTKWLYSSEDVLFISILIYIMYIITPDTGQTNRYDTARKPKPVVLYRTLRTGTVTTASFRTGIFRTLMTAIQRSLKQRVQCLSDFLNIASDVAKRDREFETGTAGQCGHHAIR
jgi:hypothetical protein